MISLLYRLPADSAIQTASLSVKAEPGNVLMLNYWSALENHFLPTWGSEKKWPTAANCILHILVGRNRRGAAESSQLVIRRHKML